MGWVTLSLRKKELKATHAYYQMRDLQIAREERQMSRSYQHQQTIMKNDQQGDIRALRQDYTSQRDAKYAQLRDLRAQLSSASQSGDTNNVQALNAEIADVQNEIDKVKEDYESNYNDTENMWEDELAMLEQEANDTETAYEQEKVDVESQMESVANEIEAIDNALSNAIKQDTIKLS